MRRIITAVILLVSSVIISCISLIVTGNIKSEIITLSDRLEYAIENSSDAADSISEDIIEKWDLFYKVCSVYISHQHLEETEKQVTYLEKYMELKDYRNASIVCRQISKSVEHLFRSEVPSIQNLF